MKASYYSTIGRPRLHLKDEASGLSLDLEPPRDTMLDMVRQNMHWLLHNGTGEERAALFEQALEVSTIAKQPLGEPGG